MRQQKLTASACWAGSVSIIRSDHEKNGTLPFRKAAGMYPNTVTYESRNLLHPDQQ
jgi:hypothetical protein